MLFRLRSVIAVHIDGARAKSVLVHLRCAGKPTGSPASDTAAGMADTPGGETAASASVPIPFQQHAQAEHTSRLLDAFEAELKAAGGSRQLLQKRYPGTQEQANFAKLLTEKIPSLCVLEKVCEGTWGRVVDKQLLGQK